MARVGLVALTVCWTSGYHCLFDTEVASVGLEAITFGH